MGKAQVKETDDKDKDSFVDELKPGTKLMHGQYTIENFLNAGGFGITYLARDSLDRKIVIKECFPGAFCRRSRYIVQARSRAHQNELKSIVRLFVQEARSLAKLDHPNIVGVHQVFEDNETAYMALDFVEGRDLLDTIEDPNSNLTPAQIKQILKEVLGAVGFIHDQGILHRDISPDNILINEQYHPVLIDFGAAREEATKQSRVLSALRVVKDGYSPQEFYIAGSEQSPSSDLYALAASFYHLINGDVPPNSQARLAAIASSESDPYVPLAGRFPEYEDHFLAALDKALAVLPKDRVQSAQDWINLMEGNEGNVTPLKVVNTSGEPAVGAAAANQQKSKMPLLLGSAAAVALLIGVGVFTMTGGNDAPAVTEQTATATVTETPQTPAADAGNAQVAETPAAPEVIEEAPVAAEPEVTEAPAAPEPAPVVVEETTPAPEPVIVEDDEPVIVTLATPEQVRPAIRPEVAAEPPIVQEPLPEPVETPRPAVAEPEASGNFPAQTGNGPAAETATPSVALPATPDAVDAIGTGPDVEIAAVTPGNELPPAAVQSSWNVQLPFAPASGGSNVIGEAAVVSPVWVQAGLEITAINGTPVESIDQISAVLQSTVTPGDADTIEATFSTLDPASGEQVDHVWRLPIIQETVLLNGVRFESVSAGSDWLTTVAEVPDTFAGDLQPGDVVTSYIRTSENITERDTLGAILDREISNGNQQHMFAVQRDGSMWVASLNYAGNAE